ncbi:hypothetical protein L6452_44139 [Arctium lappa]|uniref:Uncharacterized protein n=1 Tax=Arctium lappa TaxID=4217 RepID=A0ACB8XEA7_ARCLA|nr:hypothetical protein L6452_44139 [Arctium lappa]
MEERREEDWRRLIAEYTADFGKEIGAFWGLCSPKMGGVDGRQWSLPRVSWRVKTPNNQQIAFRSHVKQSLF